MPSGSGARPLVSARSRQLASAIADVLGATVVTSELGSLVRLDVAPAAIELDRVTLARLPGQPPPDVPLVCLDTETTGLATAAGTVAFLVGLGYGIIAAAAGIVATRRWRDRGARSAILTVASRISPAVAFGGS